MPYGPQMRQGPTSVLIRLLESLAAAARCRLELIVTGDDALRRIWEVIDLVLAILRGSVLNGMAFDARGFDAINDYDWREWLRLNGASEQSPVGQTSAQM